MIGTAQQIRRSAGGLDTPGLLEKTRSRSSPMCRYIFRRTGRMYPHERNRKIDPISREKSREQPEIHGSQDGGRVSPGVRRSRHGGTAAGEGRLLYTQSNYRKQEISAARPMDGTDPRQILRSWRCRSSRVQLAQIPPEILRAAADPAQLQQIPGRSCGAEIYTATLTNTYTERLAQLQIILDKTRRRSPGRSV